MPGAIIWQWLDGNAGRVEFKRHSFSFYDLVCPFCETKITGYETSGTNPVCVPVDRDCPHYGGALPHEEKTGYKKADLDELKFDYQFIEGNIYLKNDDNKWKRPIVMARGPADDYNRRLSNEEGVIHFLFVD